MNRQHARRIGRMAGAGLMLALWILALVFASSAQLHSQVCPDARDSSHQCAFVSVAQGFFAACLVSLTVAPVPLDRDADALPGALQPVSSGDVRLAPSRAPPFFFVLL